MPSQLPDLTEAQRTALGRYEHLYADWMRADEAATAAEEEVLAAVRARQGGAATGATLEQFERALELRLAADEALGRALEVMRAAPL